MGNKYIELWAQLVEKNFSLLLSLLVSTTFNVVFVVAIVVMFVTGKTPVEYPGYGVVHYGDKTYMVGMAQKIIQLIGDYNYATVDESFSQLSHYVKSPTIAERLTTDNADIKKNRTTQSLHLIESSMTYDKKGDISKVTYEGYIVRSLAGVATDINKKYKYTVYIRPNGSSVDLEDWKIENK